MDVRFMHPFTCLIAGPSGCGKTTFVKQLLDHKERMISPVPERVVWHYGEWQPMYDTMIGVEFMEGLPDLKTLDKKRKTLIIIDDLMAEADKSVTALFTKKSSHHNLSVLFLVQNLFDKNTEMRTISRNAKYLVLFKNPRNVSQINALAYQMYPRHVKFLQEVYEDATSKPHGYLLIDLRQDTAEQYRLRTDIMPDEDTFVYLKKK